MERSTIQARIDALESEILEKKAYLTQTDYIVTRAAEQGENLSEEFKTERESARRQINLDQEEIVILKQQLQELPESTDNEE